MQHEALRGRTAGKYVGIRTAVVPGSCSSWNPGTQLYSSPSRCPSPTMQCSRATEECTHLHAAQRCVDALLVQPRHPAPLRVITKAAIPVLVWTACRDREGRQRGGGVG